MYRMHLKNLLHLDDSGGTIIIIIMHFNDMIFTQLFDYISNIFHNFVINIFHIFITDAINTYLDL